MKIIDGDLLGATEDILGHQVNCQGEMRTGVAGQIRKKYPEAYERFLKASELVDNPNKLLGKVQIVKAKDEEKLIANLYAQFTFGYDRSVRFTDYEAIYKCLESLADYADENGLSVALPYNIGCDRGGAEWEIVYKMIEVLFEGQEITLYKKGDN